MHSKATSFQRCLLQQLNPRTSMQVVGMSSGQPVPQRAQAPSLGQGITARSGLVRPKTSSSSSPKAPAAASQRGVSLKVEGRAHQPLRESASFNAAAQGNVSASDFDNDTSLASRSSFCLDDSCASVASPVKQPAVPAAAPSLLQQRAEVARRRILAAVRIQQWYRHMVRNVISVREREVKDLLKIRKQQFQAQALQEQQRSQPSHAAVASDKLSADAILRRRHQREAKVRQVRNEVYDILSPPKRIQDLEKQQRIQHVAAALRREVYGETDLSSAQEPIQSAPSADSSRDKQRQAAAVLQAAVSRLFVSRHSVSNTLSPAHLDRSQRFSSLLSRSYNSPSPRAQPHPSPQRVSDIIADLSVHSLAQDISPRKNLSFSSPPASGAQSRTDISHASPLAWAPVDSPVSRPHATPVLSVKSAKADSFLHFLDGVDRDIDELNSKSVLSSSSKGDLFSDQNNELSLPYTPVSHIFSHPNSHSSVSARSAASAASTVGHAGASAIYSDVKIKFAQMRVEIDEKTKLIFSLKHALEDERSQRASCALEFNRQLAELSAAKDREKETALQRQLEFSDKLMRDKTELADRIESLGQQFSALKAEHERQLKQYKERLQVDMEKAVQHAVAKERSRMIDAQEAAQQRFQETTMIGYSKKLERMQATHNQELRAQRERFEDDLRSLKDETRHERQQTSEELRVRMLQEREAALEQERETCVRRLRDMSERCEAQMQSLRVKHSQELAEERERAIVQQRADRQRENDLAQRRDEEALRETKQLRRDHELAISSLARQHEAEIMELKRQVKDIKESTAHELKLRFSEELKVSEDAIRSRLEKQQSDELDIVIARLEDDFQRKKSDTQKECDERISLLKESHEVQCSSWRKREQELNEKFIKLVQGATTVDERTRQYQMQISKLESARDASDSRCRELESMISRAHADQTKAVDSVRIECAAEIATEQSARRRAEEAILSCERRLSDMNSKAANDVAKERRERDDAIAALEVKVKAILQKKDASIEQLLEKVKLSEARANEYEILLEKQRQDLLCA